MKYSQIRDMEAPNETNARHVYEIIESIEDYGWDGMPILVYAKADRLITGSHRLAAMKIFEKLWLDGEYRNNKKILDRVEDIICDRIDVAESVDDEIEAWEERHPDEDLPLDRLPEIFAGTWVERYKDELPEWD